jgi:hypothetical protein
VLIAFDYRAHGIWWVSTKEEQEAPTYEEWSRLTRGQHQPTSHRAWGDLLSDQLLDDIQAWNDSQDFTIVQEDEEDVPEEVLYDRGRQLAVRVQNELGADSWEVLYHMGGRVHRVHPPGSWPEETWQQELLGYAPRDLRKLPEEDRRILERRHEHQQSGHADGLPPAEW